jgi:hypothetical protein
MTLNKIMDRPLLEDSELIQETPQLLENKDTEQSLIDMLLNWRILAATAFIALTFKFGTPINVNKTGNLISDVYGYFSNRPNAAVQFDADKFLTEECMIGLIDADKKTDATEIEAIFRVKDAPELGIVGQYIAYAISEDRKSLEYFGTINGSKPLKLTSREGLIAGWCGEYDTIIYQSDEKVVHHPGKQFKSMLKETYDSYASFPFYKFLSKAQMVGATNQNEVAVHFHALFDPKKNSFTSPNFTNTTSAFTLTRSLIDRDKKGKPYKVELILLPDSFYTTSE